MTVPTRAPAPRLQGTRRRGERHEATADLLDARLYPESNRELLNGRFYYGWVVVGVTFVALLVSAGVRSAPGVLVHPLEVDLGWSRAAISVAVSLGLLCHGLAAPFGGWLADRLGPRLLLLVGLALVGVSTLASTAMTELWHLQVLWGVVSGAGTGLAATALGATVATRWFVARRGLVLGLFGAAASAGQLALVPGLMALIVVLGWRGAMVALAAVALAAVVPVLLFMRDDPSDLGLRPYGATAPGGTTGPSQGTPRTLSVGPGAGGASHGAVMGHAVRTPDFWLLAGSFFVCGATSTGLIGTHFIPHSIDHGIPGAALTLRGARTRSGHARPLMTGWPGRARRCRLRQPFSMQRSISRWRISTFS
jgi:MFS family permease